MGSGPEESRAPETTVAPLTDEQRMAELMEVIIAMASMDFGPRATVTSDGGQLDGIAAGLNMLAEEMSRQLDAERRRLEHASSMERLASIGQLAAGVAHEVNNPAAFILANLGVIDEKVGDLETLFQRLRATDASGSVVRELADGGVDALLDDLRSMVADNADGMRRIVSIVRDLRLFARVDEGVIETVRLDELAADACRMLAHEVAARADLRRDLAPVPGILGDRARLAQVVTNLLLNAAQAIPEGAPAAHHVRVTTACRDGTIVLEVADTGVGMEMDVQARVFQPFFTTKPREQGTGLGLAVSRDIARHHGGALVFRSEPGKGTTFELRLPRVTGLQATVVRHAAPSITAEKRPRILFVDDEAALLVAYRRQHARHYDVGLAQGGQEALRVLQRDPRWDLVVCDVLMPDVDGPAVHAWIAEHHPQLLPRLVYCTGGVFTPRSRAFALSLSQPPLDKPLSGARLAELLAHVLAECGSA